jgi:sugar phosphate isomerase/epimerase
MQAFNEISRKYCTDRIISVSGAPYDGHAFPTMLESLAKIGATHVEPAFIVGYTEPFDETSFTHAKSVQYERWLSDSGIGCYAFSSHIDLGREDAVEVFRGRMDFARKIGARVINTNASARKTSERFFQNIAILARHAEELDMWIGLENPGDGSDNLLNVASDSEELLRSIAHPRVALNYDAGNTVSHRPAVNATQDALDALPQCLYTHIKDVSKRDDGFFFSGLGQGTVDCARILQHIAQTPLCLSIEMPLRLHRLPDAKPSRHLDAVPLTEIEIALSRALDFVHTHLDTPNN